MKRKSLVGWIHRNWDLYFECGSVCKNHITKNPICKPEFNKQVKVRIIIEEVK